MPSSMKFESVPLMRSPVLHLPHSSRMALTGTGVSMFSPESGSLMSFSSQTILMSLQGMPATKR